MPIVGLWIRLFSSFIFSLVYFFFFVFFLCSSWCCRVVEVGFNFSWYMCWLSVILLLFFFKKVVSSFFNLFHNLSNDLIDVETPLSNGLKSSVSNQFSAPKHQSSHQYPLDDSIDVGMDDYRESRSPTPEPLRKSEEVILYYSLCKMAILAVFASGSCFFCVRVCVLVIMSGFLEYDWFL